MLDQMESLMTDKQRRAIYDVTRTMTYHDTRSGCPLNDFYQNIQLHVDISRPFYN